VRIVRDFDELYTAPHRGFDGAEDYYAKVSSQRFLANIEVPTLLLHAQDDPLVPYAPLLRVESQANPNILVVAPTHGGHVGFVSRARGSKRFWAGWQIVRLCNRLYACFRGGETPLL
jgi:predicted alpha/beta-fold hydrolase